LPQEKKIYYWSPHLVNIATPRAVINSAYSVQRYSGIYKCFIVNFFCEFEFYESEISDKGLKLINHYKKKIINFLPKHGFFLSRFSFIVLFILALLPLKNLIKKDKPAYLIIHLITSLPLLLLIFFKFDTKFILRISGRPRVNFIRKFFWKLAFKKIYAVTCPTLGTLNYLKNLDIIDNKKIILLHDPIINLKELIEKKLLAKKEGNFDNKNYFLAAGRLSRQKNFLFLCKSFRLLVSQYPDLKLVIAGDGEDREKILSFIRKNNLKNNIILIGHVDNIYYYFKNAKYFILSSLWEDPGFVLLEAAIARVLVISSDCESGPKELIKDNINGVLFSSNNMNSLVEKVQNLFKINEFDKKKMIYNNIILSKKFTLFYHYNQFKKILF
jgi:glycosyltransferase involved in cell wall biosynthesis